MVKSREEAIGIVEELIELYFPKDECQERGAALVLLAVFIYKLYDEGGL